MKELLHGLRHYADFSGRDDMRLFWVFVTYSHLIVILLLLPALYVVFEAFSVHLADLFYLQNAEDLHEFAQCVFIDSLREHQVALILLYLDIACICALIVPSVAALVRRLRDAGQCVWWALPPVAACVPLLPFSCISGMLLSIVTLVYCCKDSVPPPEGESQSD